MLLPANQSSWTVSPVGGYLLDLGLSRDEIERVRNVIAQLDSKSVGDCVDRRENPRIDFKNPLWLNLPAEPGRPWIQVFSRNLSTCGLAILSRKLFYVDQHVVIAHELKEPCSQLVLARVCFCRSIQADIQEVGLAFVVNLKDPEKIRRVPPTWLALVLHNDHLARQKFPAGVSA